MSRLLVIMTMSLLLFGGATFASGWYLVRNLPTIALDALPAPPPCPAGIQAPVDVNDRVARFILAVEGNSPPSLPWPVPPDQLTRYVADLSIPEPAPERRSYLSRLARALQLGLFFRRSEIESAFLARVYFGKAAFGYRCAAQVYFGKAASELNQEEAIFLAGLPKAPNRNIGDTSADEAHRRKTLASLRRHGLIGEATTSN
ncbi:hypothetical protein FZC33_32910 [Labrys sp. KNU-23]|uniref:transglycosylase domain-containing protein n=1 Tax=Labrys sp. KNU-23 TaxID=2789216 RepID=UPI0011F08690|nr:transglycosylase domain-containing protein [Labrys sp. KNU-23]QEN90804.1 hypothetical protein FZC33_32910 [Labrys sp. KNU-23]